MAVDVWKLRLLPASFRGIPFFVDSHEFQGGRNVISHEPPDREASFGEDMGRKSQIFRIEGHVIGDLHSFIRDGLIRAMENGTSGLLIHPYLGRKIVFPGGFSFTESNTEGRIARFTLEFVIAGNLPAPLALISEIVDFATTVVTAVAQVQNAFQLAYAVSGLPGFVFGSMIAIGEEFVDTVVGSVRGIASRPDEFADLNVRLTDFTTDLGDLVRNPASYIFETDAIVAETRDVPEESPERTTIDIGSGRDDSLDVFRELVAFEPAEAQNIPLTTATRIQQKANADAITQATRQLAIIRFAENAIAKEYTSTDEAISVRDEIVNLLEIEMKATPDDDMFQILSDLKQKVVATLPPTDLQSIESLTLNDTLPAIVIAYNLYESLDNELDLIERNRIENPSFVSGELEVLSG